MTDDETLALKIELTLGYVIAGWSLLCIVFASITRSFRLDEMWAGPRIWTSINILLMTVVSPVFAAIVVIVAVRRLPAARPFLRKFVAALLLTAILGGGFYCCATWAHEGTLWRSLSNNLGSGTGPSMQMSPLVNALEVPCYMVSNAQWNRLDSSGVLLAVIRPCASMTILPCFVLMLITPSFLALPVFWLVVVLGMLYVVLPPRVWVWLRTRTKLLWARARHHQEDTRDGNFQ